MTEVTILICKYCGIQPDGAVTELSWTEHYRDCGRPEEEHWWTLDCPEHGTMGVRLDYGQLDLGIVSDESSTEPDPSPS